MENCTPEEKLLRLIKDKKNRSNVPPAQDQPDEPVGLKNREFSAFDLIFKKYASWLDTRKISAVVLFISCVYFLSVFRYTPQASGVKSAKSSELTHEALNATIEAPVNAQNQDLKPQISEPIALFGFIHAPQAQSPTQQEELSTAVAEDFASQMNLIGIISGENPQAILEDKKTQKTYYVTKGQIIGSAQIEDIQENKIILSSQGKKFELGL
jgi:type II secretory pathway component PulC